MLYLSEADPYESLRSVVHPALAGLPAEELEAALRLHGVDAEGLNDFIGGLSQVGSQIGQRLPAITQGAVQGASMGAVAGPYGALLGALGGAVAGGVTAPSQPAAPPARASQPSAQPAPQPAPPQPPAQPVTPATPAPSAGGSAAAQQILALLADPRVVQALVAMALGSAGARTVDVSGTPVPVAAVPATLSTLANQAASEYTEVFGDELAAPAPVEAVVRPLRPRRSRSRRFAPEQIWIEQASYDRVYA